MNSNIFKGVVFATLLFVGVYWFFDTESTQETNHAPKIKTSMQDKQLEVGHKEPLFTRAVPIDGQHTQKQITAEELIANVEATLEQTEEAYERQLPTNFYEVQAEIDAGLEGYQEEAQEALQNIISLHTENQGSFK